MSARECTKCGATVTLCESCLLDSPPVLWYNWFVELNEKG